METVSEEVFYKSASELSEMLEKGEITSVELTKSVIERTKAIDGQINAFLSYDEAMTMALAEASDARRAKGEARGPLDGIPLTLKDNICQQGQPLTCASKILEKYISPYSATVTQKLLDAGLVLWGRANLDEFAMGSSTEHSAFKETANPWKLEATPGGSSGGSAASVTSGETILALGSDTGGSIRQPAAYCGIVGMKPTYGLVSRYGLSAFASSLDQIGTFGRTVEDAAMTLQVIAGNDSEHDSTSSNCEIPDYRAALHGDWKPKKIGVLKEFMEMEGLNDEVKAAFEKAVDYYKSQGCEIVEVSLPSVDLSIPTYYIIATAEASSNLARYDGVRYTTRSPKADNLKDLYDMSRAEGFGAEVKRRIMLGTFVLCSGYFDAYYTKAQKIRTLIRNDFMKAYEDVDVILTPTAPDTAFTRGEKTNDPLAMYLEDIFTIPVNLAGVPGISLPCGFDSAGKPIGLQIIGQPFKESEMFCAAHMFEKGHDFANQHPKL